MAKKHRAFRIVGIALLAVFVAVFLLYQIYMMTNKPVKTQTAFAADVYRTVETDIYAVREEKTLSASYAGYVVPMVNHCDKVANGQAIAAVFSDEAAAQSYTSYLELKDEIDYYTRLSESTVSQYTDLDKLIQEADNAVFDFTSAVYQRNLVGAMEKAMDIRSKITARQSASGETISYSEILASLNAQKAAALAAAGQYTSLRSPCSGYYMPEIDGYENLIPYDSVSTMTVGDIDRALSLTARETENRSTGKLISSFDWYFVCNIDLSYMGDIKVGQTKKVILPFSAADDFTAEVYKINDTKDGKTAVVFRVNSINVELASLRVEHASIVLDSYSGYKIPNEAIRVIDGVKGVYILRNNLVSFKKIDIFYSSDDYSIVGNAESKSGYIRLYDEVITEGTDLYDGKLVG